MWKCINRLRISRSLRADTHLVDSAGRAVEGRGTLRTAHIRLGAVRAPEARASSTDFHRFAHGKPGNRTLFSYRSVRVAFLHRTDTQLISI